MDHRALPISEPNSNNDNTNVEDEFVEEDNYSPNEVPLSFEELLVPDPHLNLTFETNNDFIESFLEEQNQYMAL